MTLLQTHGLLFQSDPPRAVREIDLTVEPGQVVSLISSNRARLLTIVRMLEGNLRPDAGTILLNGEEITRRSPRWRRRAGLVSMMLARQRSGLAAWRKRQFTVEQELRWVWHEATGPGAGSVLQEVEDVLERMGLGPFCNVLVNQLPPPQQPFFDLACCLAWRPRLFLFCDPFLHLTGEQAVAWRAHVQHAQANGAAFLITDPTFAAVLPIAKRFFALSSGRLICEGTTEEIFRHSRARELHFWEELANLHGVVGESRLPSLLQPLPPRSPPPPGIPIVDQAFSSLAVILRYPTPIALSYRRFCRQPEPTHRLQMLFATLETTLRYLVFLGLADLLTCPSRGDDSHSVLSKETFDFLHVPRPMVLGKWAAAVGELATALQGEPQRFFKEFPEICGPQGSFLKQGVAGLIALRNRVIHPADSLPPDAEQCRELLQQARPELEQLLQQIQFVTAYALGFCQRSQVAPRMSGWHRYYLHSCMGARPSDTGSAYTVEPPQTLPEQVPFVVAPSGGQLLCLWPFLVQRVARASGQHTLYLFEGIADRQSGFLAEVKSVALDGRDTWRQVLRDAPASNLDWLCRRLREQHARLEVASQLCLHEWLGRRRSGSLVGHCLGPYRLLAVLGAGGFGTVYAADHLDTGERVAVKVIEDAEALRHVDRFQREFAKLRQAGKHPNIVRCLSADCDVIQGREYPWYAMEFAGGGDLGERIQERRAGAAVCPWQDPAVRADVVREFQDVASAVAHLHRLGMVHRDVKPANVLILDDGTLRLSDFDLTKSVVPSEQSLLAGAPTTTGAVLGTRDYMAPEQARGLDVDSRADVYSLGVLLAELLTGQRPQIGSAGTQGSALDPKSVPAWLPAPLRRFILRCTDQDPDHRPQDGQAVFEQFMRVLQQVGQPPAETE